MFFTKMAMMSSFSPPFFNPAIRHSPSPYIAEAAPGGSMEESVMIASGSSGRGWHVVEKVAECLFGEVLRAMDTLHGGSYAIKQMSLEMISRRAGHNSEDPLKEISALQFLKAHGPLHNIIEVVEVLRDAEYIYVVLPYCHGGELFRMVSANRRLSEDIARPIFRGLLAGMACLHSLQICHRDMSLENILLTEHDEVKIIDFGMVLRFGQQQAQAHGGEAGGGAGAFDGDRRSGGSDSSSARSVSPTGPFGKKHYMAPEVAMNQRIYDGFAVDIWAVGIIMFITLAGFPPFRTPIPGEDERCHFIAVDRRLLDLAESWQLNLSPQAVDLIQACLLFDPSERSPMRELQNHPWLA